jgi:hypothetical protein
LRPPPDPAPAGDRDAGRRETGRPAPRPRRILSGVKLTSRDGTSVELRPIDYENEANPRAEPGTDWDANWVLVRGNVAVADGAQWTFLDPCLTTWEAPRVSRWLRAVVDGTVHEIGLWTDETPFIEPHFTFFNEPNVALSLERRTGERARIRVHFSLEALPPDSERLGMFQYFLVLDLSLDDVTAAADQWDADCEPFPVR